jgi:inosine-uridine nucleoside N-ribohydrolase
MVMLALVLAACSTAAPTGPVSTGPGAPATAAPPVPTQPGATTAPAPSLATPAARTILFDTDVAGDDLVAIAFLVAAPHVELAAITVSGTGEAHCGGGVDVVLRLLERLGAPDIPVACGRETPLAGTHEFPSDWRAHVDDGSGLDLPPTDRQPSTSTAVELITSLTRSNDELTVLSTGPLTNLADALLQDAGLADRLGPVYVMGGALHVPGNLVCCGAPEDNDVAEWNIYVDPRAANVVVDSGVTPFFVSLDGTNQVPLTREFAGLVMASAQRPASQVVAELFEANPFMADGSFYLWDSLAAQVAAGYPVGSSSPACIVVEEAEGPESGFTRPGCKTPNIQYLGTADAAAAEATLLGVLNGG